MVKSKIILFFLGYILIFSITSKNVASWDYCSYTSDWHCVNGDWCRDLWCCWYDGGCDKDWHCSGECSGDDDGGDNGGETVTSSVIRCRCADWDPTPGCTEIGTCSGPANAGDCNGDDPIKYSCPSETPSAVCGNNDIESGEECDDGNTDIEICDYGETSCQVCDENCQLIYGETFYCGDGNINSIYGEECDDGKFNGEIDYCNIAKHPY